MFFLKFAHRCEHLIFLSDSVIQILLKVFNLFLHSVCLSFEHIFLEFVPFDDEHFDSEGHMRPHSRPLMIHEVEEGRDYAILLSTAAGAWRYLIGDTVRFTDKERCEIVITGRARSRTDLCPDVPRSKFEHCV